MIDQKNFFDQPVKNKITYSNIKKITTSQGDDYTTGYLLEYINVFHFWRSKKTCFELFTRNCKSIVNELYDNLILLIECQYKMTWYNRLKIKLSNSQLKKLKSAIKNESEF